MTEDIKKPHDIDEMEDILDDLRTRFEETPQWEFCEGFMVALICCRRPIGQAEYLDVLLGIPDTNEMIEETGSFADAAQRERFLGIWNRRWEQIQTALDTEVESLEDDAAYQPEIADVRGTIAELSEAERAELSDQYLPAFAQVWALGFMYAVEAWPEEWHPPKERKLAQAHDAALESIVALTEDDEGEAEISPYGEDATPSMSMDRLNAYADALWAVYDLRAIWSQIGARVPTLQRSNLPGRNDPCHCGSGKKFKKCCGA